MHISLRANSCSYSSPGSEVACRCADVQARAWLARACALGNYMHEHPKNCPRAPSVLHPPVCDQELPFSRACYRQLPPHLFHSRKEGPRGDAAAEVGKQILPHQVHSPLTVKELLGGPHMWVCDGQQPAPANSTSWITAVALLGNRHSIPKSFNILDFC